VNETKRYWDLLDWNKEELVNHIIDLEKYSNEDKKEIRNLKQSQNNWNKLKKWLEEGRDYRLYLFEVLDKMQKLEGNNE
jgi:hypothetical protein